MSRPQGAPRGLLYYYILHRISLKPAHGYEILIDIGEKTEGAWRPGAGSIYPMLKKLVTEGLIETERTRRVASDQRVYRITTKGKQRLEEAKTMFASAGQRWSAMRRIFIEMLSPGDVGKFIVDGSKLQFDITREMLESKIESIPPSEAEFILKEYALNLERQLDWNKRAMTKLKKGRVQAAVSS